MRQRSKSLFATKAEAANFLKKEHSSDEDDGDFSADEEQLYYPDLVQSRPVTYIEEEEEDEGDEEEEVEDEEEEQEEKKPFTWTSENELKLLGSVYRQIPIMDKLPFDQRIGKIKWEQIPFPQVAVAELKSHFHELLNRTRTFRLLKEVLQDVEKSLLSEMKLPQKPRSAFLLFATENKDKIKHSSDSGPFLKQAMTLFNKLSDAEKEHYKSRSDSIRKEYNSVVSKLNLENKKSKSGPKEASLESPLSLFWQHTQLAGDGTTYFEARKKYAEAKDEEKLKWILRFLGVNRGNKCNLAQYEKAQSCLHKDEMAILHEYEGRPKKASAYTIFLKDYFSKNRNNSDVAWTEFFKSGVQQWRSLSPERKEHFEKLSKKIKDNYPVLFEEYLQSLPEDRREIESRKPQRKSAKRANETEPKSKESPTKKEKDTTKSGRKSKDVNDKSLDKKETSITKKSRKKSLDVTDATAKLVAVQKEKKAKSKTSNENVGAEPTATPTKKKKAANAKSAESVAPPVPLEKTTPKKKKKSTESQVAKPRPEWPVPMVEIPKTKKRKNSLVSGNGTHDDSSAFKSPPLKKIKSEILSDVSESGHSSSSEKKSKKQQKRLSLNASIDFSKANGNSTVIAPTPKTSPAKRPKTSSESSVASTSAASTSKSKVKKEKSAPATSSKGSPVKRQQTSSESSVASTSATQKVKKEKAKPNKKPTENLHWRAELATMSKPARTLKEWYIRQFDGSRQEAKAAFKALDKKARKALYARHTRQNKKYLAQFEAFLQKLSKDEMHEFCKEFKQEDSTYSDSSDDE